MDWWIEGKQRLSLVGWFAERGELEDRIWEDPKVDAGGCRWQIGRAHV